MVSEEQIKALNTRKDELYTFINIKVKETEADKLEVLSQQNDFWNNPKEAQIILKQLSTLKSWIRSYDNVSNNIDELNVLLELSASDDELNQQLIKTKIAVEDLEFKNM